MKEQEPRAIETTPTPPITPEQAEELWTGSNDVVKQILPNNLRFKERIISREQQAYQCYFGEDTFAVQSIDATKRTDGKELVEITAYPSGLLYPENYIEIRYQNTSLHKDAQEIQFGVRLEEGEEKKWVTDNMSVRTFDDSFISLPCYAPQAKVLETLPFIIERIQALTALASEAATPPQE